MLRWRSPLALALAGVALLPGLGALGAAKSLQSAPRLYLWFLGALGTVAWWGVFVFFPRKIERRDRSMAILAAIFGLIVGALATFANLQQDQIRVTTHQTWAVAGDAMGVALSVGAYSGLPALVAILPLRIRRLSAADTGAARSIGIVAVGLVLFTCGTLGDFAAAVRGQQSILWGALDAIFILIPTLLWALGIRGNHPRIARNVVVASVTIWVASYVLGSQLAWATGSILGALLLGYAILRGMIEGLDLKVRFAISKSTIAAVFIAVFFVASETAQQFFGDQLGSTYIGIGAAGALVFAIAPLHRAAERFAEKAVPIASASSDTAQPKGSRAEQSFGTVLRRFLRDGRITRDEERALAHLAGDLKIDAGRAFELREQIEREMQKPRRSA